MDAPGIIEALKRLGVPHERIAAVLGRDRTAATKLINGVRGIKVHELEPLRDLIGEYEQQGGNTDPEVAQMDYVAVEILPTYAGLGGGGTGDADRSTALMPRALIEQDLRARPEDLLLINLRGDSMLDPATGKGFMHGDQVLVDRRDANPRQPGAFALWFDDGYVLKNVEIIRRTGKLRIFSNNPAYSPDEADPGEVTIMGRPVWFARRL